jgi:hypothetical protein
MMLNVGIAIDMLAVPVTLSRSAPGAYTAEGTWLQGAATSTPIRAVVQPITGEAKQSSLGQALKDMPEGIRTEAQYVAWSRSEIVLDDTIVYKGGNYRVLFVWSRDEGGFHRALLGLLK